MALCHRVINDQKVRDETRSWREPTLHQNLSISLIVDKRVYYFLIAGNAPAIQQFYRDLDH